MTPLIVVIALLVVVGLGMCIGGAIERGYAYRALMRAQRAEDELRRLRAELDNGEAWIQARCVDSGSSTVLPAAPVVVNLHLPAGLPGWARPPVVDGQVLRELPGSDR